ncbi:MAG: hypothetical protein WC966_03905 [Bradymonadales bacterium]
MIYDVQACEGGHRYCRGKNNPPVKLIENHPSYRCLPVKALPGINATKDLKTWVCTDKTGCPCKGTTCKLNQSCTDTGCVDLELEPELCGDQPILEGYRCVRKSLGFAVQETILVKGLACDQESCACASTTCPQDTYCQNGKCYCGLYPFPTAGYRCESRLLYNGEAQKSVCVQEEGCLCAGKKVEKEGTCEIECYGKGELKEQGCFCGANQIDPASELCIEANGELFSVCKKPRGCKCNDKLCPPSTLCREGSCIDPLTNKAIPELLNDSQSLQISMPCSLEKGCECGKGLCSQGNYCLGAKCYRRLRPNIVNNQRVYYDFAKIPDGLERRVSDYDRENVYRLALF